MMWANIWNEPVPAEGWAIPELFVSVPVVAVLLYALYRWGV
jgi:hypothetical protein